MLLSVFRKRPVPPHNQKVERCREIGVERVALGGRFPGRPNRAPGRAARLGSRSPGRPNRAAGRVARQGSRFPGRLEPGHRPAGSGSKPAPRPVQPGPRPATLQASISTPGRPPGRPNRPADRANSVQRPFFSKCYKSPSIYLGTSSSPSIQVNH